MNLMAAVDENWAIALKGSLLVRIPSDGKFFQQTTADGVVVMGRRMLENFSNSLPVSGRTTLVLSKNQSLSVRGALVVHSVEETLDKLKEYGDREVYVIGGNSVYRQFLPYCGKAYITKIHHIYDADTYLPDLDQDPDWVLTADSEEQTYFNLEYYNLIYERKK